MKAINELRGHDDNKGIDHQKKKTKRENCYRYGENGEYGFYNGIQKSQNHRHQKCREVVVDRNAR